MAIVCEIKLKSVAVISSQTPIIRHFRRLSAIGIYGIGKRHWYQWNPGLEIEKPTEFSNGVVKYRDREIVGLQAFSQLRQKVGRHEIAIIGTGPSIQMLEIERLVQKNCFLLNGAAYLLKDHDFLPAAFCVEDERFVWSHFKEVQTEIPMKTACLFSPSVLRAICEISPQWLTDRPVYLIDNLAKPYLGDSRKISALAGDANVILNEAKTVGFSIAPWAGICPAGTIAYSALQFAAATAPPSIGLAGIDLTVDPNKPRFYEVSGKSKWSGIANSRGRILESIQLAMEYFSQNGIMLENYSEHSALNDIHVPYSREFARDSGRPE